MNTTSVEYYAPNGLHLVYEKERRVLHIYPLHGEIHIADIEIDTTFWR